MLQTNPPQGVRRVAGSDRDSSQGYREDVELVALTLNGRVSSHPVLLDWYTPVPNSPIKLPLAFVDGSLDPFNNRVLHAWNRC